MKGFTTNLLVAAAALMVVAGSASAQMLKAVIPFPFRAGESGMAPGTYHVRMRQSAGSIVTVYSVDESRAVMVLATALTDAPKNVRSGQPTLSFLCTGTLCELASVSPGYGQSTIKLPTSKATRLNRADVRVVTLTAAKAD